MVGRRLPPGVHTTLVFPYYKWFAAYMSQEPIKYIDRWIRIIRHDHTMGPHGICAEIDYRVVDQNNF